MRAVCLIPVIFAATLLSCSTAEKVEPPRTYQMGDHVRLGHLVYTVFERQWHNQFGTGVNARLPQNRFYAIRVSVVNSAAGDTIIPNTALVDDAGTSYPEAGDGDGLQDWIGNQRQVAAAGTVQGFLLFDVPPKHYKLRVMGEEEKQTGLVEIPLSFDADSPDLPTPDLSTLPPKK